MQYMAILEHVRNYQCYILNEFNLVSFSNQH